MSQQEKIDKKWKIHQIFRFSSWDPAHFPNNVHRPVTRGGTIKLYNCIRTWWITHTKSSIVFNCPPPKKKKKNTNKSSASQIDISSQTELLFCCVRASAQVELYNFISFVASCWFHVKWFVWPLLDKRNQSIGPAYIQEASCLLIHHPKRGKKKKTCWTMTWREKERGLKCKKKMLSNTTASSSLLFNNATASRQAIYIVYKQLNSASQCACRLRNVWASTSIFFFFLEKNKKTYKFRFFIHRHCLVWSFLQILKSHFTFSLLWIV